MGARASASRRRHGHALGVRLPLRLRHGAAGARHLPLQILEGRRQPRHRHAFQGHPRRRGRARRARHHPRAGQKALHRQRQQHRHPRRPLARLAVSSLGRGRPPPAAEGSRRHLLRQAQGPLRLRLSHRRQRHEVGTLRRRLPQSLRHRLQLRRRALHLRQRHGVGPRPPVVSPHAHPPRRPRRRIRLPRRQRKMARVFPRLAPRRGRHRRRLPHRDKVRHRRERLAGKIPPRALPARLDVWPHPRRHPPRERRELHREERPHQLHLPQGRRGERRRGSLPQRKRNAGDGPGIPARRLDGLHRRRPRHRGGAVSGELSGERHRITRQSGTRWRRKARCFGERGRPARSFRRLAGNTGRRKARAIRHALDKGTHKDARCVRRGAGRGGRGARAPHSPSRDGRAP